MGSKTRLSSYCTKRANNGVNLVTSRKINTRLARPIGVTSSLYLCFDSLVFFERHVSDNCCRERNWLITETRCSACARLGAKLELGFKERSLSERTARAWPWLEPFPPPGVAHTTDLSHDITPLPRYMYSCDTHILSGHKQCLSIRYGKCKPKHIFSLHTCSQRVGDPKVASCDKGIPNVRLAFTLRKI